MLVRALAFKPLLSRCPAGSRIGNQTTKRLFQDGRPRDSSFGLGQGQRMTMKERLMQPTSGLPFAVGRGVVIGASAFGMGALAFYGLGLSRQSGAFDRSMGWDQQVRDRIRSTYFYFGSGIVVTAAAAAAIFRSPRLLALASQNSIVACVVTIGALMASGIVVQTIPYSPGFGSKQMAYMFHAALLGAVLAPLSVVGGPILLRAAIYTAGIAGGLSTIAACAPSDKFLTWGGPLAIGMGVVFASNIGALFLPPTSALGAGLYSIVLYGGLVLFSGFLLYDTQRIIKKAETHPPAQYATRPYDPVNAALSIYMDVMNIFIRMVMILSGGGGKRK